MKVLVIHGPNLNMLGRREPEIYGVLTIADIDNKIRSKATELGIDVFIVQSNGEAEIIEAIQKADYDTLIINPAAYTHTSIAIRDAISAVGKPAIEVHLSNIHRREEFRKKSYIAEVSVGQISGFGADSYILALMAAKNILSAG
ncbi:MAG: type II 3-dehydroquinate dehydratase [Thermodesulfovibrionales bacterium]